MGGTNEFGSGGVEGDSVFYADSEKDVTDQAWKDSPYYADWNGDFDRRGILGGFCSTIFKLQQWMPQAKIILCSPIGGGSYVTCDNAVENGVKTSVLPTSGRESMTLEKIARIMEDAAWRMNVPYFNIYRDTSISMFNRNMMIADGVHPYILTDKGGVIHNTANDLMALTIAGKMNTILPLMKYDDFAEFVFSGVALRPVVDDAPVADCDIKLVSAHGTFSFDARTDSSGCVTLNDVYGRLTYKVMCSVGDVQYVGYVNITSSDMDETVSLSPVV